MDGLTEICSESQARMEGQRWAYAHGFGQAQMSDFAATVFRSAGTQVISHRALLDELQRFARACDHVDTQWSTYGAQEWKLRDDWILETVKHLALVNIAGLAGAIALYAANQSLALKLSIGAFGIGLLLAVIDLFVNAKAHYLNGLRANTLRGGVKQAKSWDDLDATAKAKWSSASGDRCTECAEVAGGVSALLAIIGMVSLVSHLT